jgi:prepilin-type processing-associated H-X9-DG protein
MMNRRGFSIIEILVIIGVIAINLALLVPAIQQSREDARTRSCKNQLKQLGLAIHNYYDTHRGLPPGWVSKEGMPGLGSRIGWQTFILPYLDQAPLYVRIDFQKPPHDTNNKPLPLFQTKLPIYRCPADPAPDLNPLRGEYATSNYSGNYGHIPAPRLGSLGISDVWPGAMEAPMWSRGLFARNTIVRFQDVTDGLSNTLLIGERGFASGAGIWVGVTDNAHEDDTLTDSSHRSRLNSGWSSFSSRHKGGVNVLMADGVVRFVSNQIDSQPAPGLGTFQKLACKDDGMPLSDF